MEVLLLLLVGVTLTLGSECGPLKQIKVKRQWSQAYGTGHHRLEFAREVFQHFFDHHPEARDLFTRVKGKNIHSPEFEGHMARVFGGLDLTIGLLDDKPTLDAALQHLHDQHKDRNIDNDYYDSIGGVLLEAIAKQVDHFDKEAWLDCGKHILDSLKTKEEEASGQVEQAEEPADDKEEEKADEKAEDDDKEEVKTEEKAEENTADEKPAE